MNTLEVTDEQYHTLVTVLDLVAQADHGSNAVWFNDNDREKLTDLHNSVDQQVRA